MLKYLKDHILEELEGAIDYLEKAIECKKSPMGYKFYRMSEMEVEHANCLTKMLNNLEKDEASSDTEYSAVYKSVLDAYTTHMGKIESLKKLYYS